MKQRLLKILKRILVVVLSLILLLVAFAFFFMQKAIFGKLPAGERLAIIQQAPNYKDGKFENATITPILTEGHSLWGEMYKSLFGNSPRLRPSDIIPSVKTDLIHLSPDSNVVVWFGHSSCFIQLDGKRILIDPVFNKTPSPVPGSIEAFDGSNVYTVAEMPSIDYLLISHDHYDHLDYNTVLDLKGKVKKVICGLGVGADFEYWGYPKDKIIERNWHQKVTAGSGFTIFTEPTRHNSGRTLRRDKTLWLSYILKAPSKTIFISGDGGYGSHFKDIGDKYGPVDLAIIENGQYDSAWHYIHLLPEETLKAAKDLGAKRLMPYHNSKFVLGRHEWNTPMRQLTMLDKTYRIPLVTPVIGEVVNLNDTSQTFKQWWETVQ